MTHARTSGAPPAQRRFRVGLIGRGSIAGHLETLIGASDYPLTIIGSIGRSAGSNGTEFTELCASADIVIECASVDAVSTWAPRVLASGTPLIITSVGALANQALRHTLQASTTSFWLTTGAIGGLDLICAAALSGGLTGIKITTAKRAQAFNPALVAGLGEGRRTIFRGTPDEAIQAFPATANVTVALSLSAPGVPVEVEVIADGSAERTVHRIQASGSAGSYDFRIDNEVNPENPKSSGLTARALLAALVALAGGGIALPSGHAPDLDPAVRLATRFI
ncbi:aspartate dehydrogenase domain-containing protein [Haematomicrobium sanguinis]|uniref:aspartate dehydrogenase domain-containing protein n=1 Tax=Haematomicrobium sanguinis TaxID=479106 RepID=UPI00068FDB28|nr:aspartate dehydrogenase domain-containing protein [Haematomicrobium sanguinis]